MKKMEILNTLATKGYERISKAEKRVKGMAIANGIALEMYSIIIEIKDAKEYDEAMTFYMDYKAKAKEIWNKLDR